MKKTIFALMIILAGCSKASTDQPQKKCYHVQFGINGGGAACHRSDIDTCVDPWVEVQNIQFVDKCNNDLDAIFTLK